MSRGARRGRRRRRRCAACRCARCRWSGAGVGGGGRRARCRRRCTWQWRPRRCHARRARCWERRRRRRGRRRCRCSGHRGAWPSIDDVDRAGHRRVNLAVVEERAGRIERHRKRQRADLDSIVGDAVVVSIPLPDRFDGLDPEWMSGSIDVERICLSACECQTGVVLPVDDIGARPAAAHREREGLRRCATRVQPDRGNEHGESIDRHTQRCREGTIHSNRSLQSRLGPGTRHRRSGSSGHG